MLYKRAAHFKSNSQLPPGCTVMLLMADKTDIRRHNWQLISRSFIFKRSFPKRPEIKKYLYSEHATKSLQISLQIKEISLNSMLKHTFITGSSS